MELQLILIKLRLYGIDHYQTQIYNLEVFWVYQVISEGLLKIMPKLAIH